METRGQCVVKVVPLVFLTHRRVEHLHTVAVVKELAAGFLASACVREGLGARGPVGAPVHQHLSRDHDDDSDKNFSYSQCQICSSKKLRLDPRKAILSRKVV